MSSASAPPEKILGVSFFCGTAADAVAYESASGTLMVVVHAPALLKLYHDAEYRRALQEADVVLADSGLLALLWRLVSGHRLPDISGIAYLKELLAQIGLTKPKVMWVLDPGDAGNKAVAWLRKSGVNVAPEDICFLSRGAAQEGHHSLLLEVERLRPQHVVLAAGGGEQEKVALYLRSYLIYGPRIHCVGAALRMLAGIEGSIPEWAMRWHLGWLFRLISQPSMLFPRIGIAFMVTGMVLKWRAEMPPLTPTWSDR
jgi:UDP-N-acetyl-D-mannosaminuronic acid transferase (WecB/TagA/CpsF family)